MKINKSVLIMFLNLILLLFFLSGELFAYKNSDLKKLKNTKKCIKCDLSGANLQYTNLSGSNLNKANLSKANLSKANLNKANLSETNLNKANLRRADLTGVDLRNANLKSAKLTGADLTGAILSGAILKGAILSWAKLVDGDLTGADLRGANLTGTNLKNAKLTKIIIDKKVISTNEFLERSAGVKSEVAFEKPSLGKVETGDGKRKVKKIKVYREKINNGFEVYVDNNDIVQYSLKLNLNLFNYHTNIKNPILKVLPAKTKKILLVKVKRKSNNNTKFSYNFRYKVGDYNAKHNENQIYLLPYEHGKKFYLSQGYNGIWSHQGEFAIDFNMEEGEKIYSARGGIVFNIKEDSKIGGPDRNKFIKHGNEVNVMHDDGTYAKYVHLRYNGVVVENGKRVQRGDLLGYSGNTGWSTEPHLHFAIYKVNSKLKPITIPTRFLNHDEKIISLKEGLYYYSTHPGKPKYKIKLGRLLKNEFYENYKKNINENKKISIRKEQIDNCFVLFLQNGFTNNYVINLNLNLNNYIPSKNIPIKKTLKPLSEEFGVILCKENNKKDSSFTSKYTFKPL